MMSDSSGITASTVARRCQVSKPEYTLLTSLDWVILDFTDGKRTFEDMQSTIPVRREALESSFNHLSRLGFIEWDNVALSGKSEDSDKSDAPAGASKASSASSPASYSTEVCLQYLPPRLINEFRAFKPQLTDASLDLPVEVQVFVEFLHENLSRLSPCDLLGLTEGQYQKPQIKQGYVLRTKQFHPDRYFRKNLGPFQPRIAAIFKAVTAAFTKLQSGR
jgi:hypothetical protein